MSKQDIKKPKKDVKHEGSFKDALSKLVKEKPKKKPSSNDKG